MPIFRLAASAALALCLPLASSAETYELQNGDKVSGEVITRTDTHVELQHPVLGKLVVPLAELKKEEPRPGLLGTPFLAGWNRTIHLGITGQRNESETTDVIGALDLDYDDDHIRWNVDGRYAFSSADRETTKHNAFAEVKRDEHFDGTPWFWFASGRYDWDEFRAWDHRVNAITGVGYAFVDTERFQLLGRAGPSVTREFGGTDEWRYEAMLGVDAKWQVADDHTVEVTNRYFQAINSDSPYRNLTTAAWKWRLSEDPGLSLSLGIENEYDSEAGPEGSRNDLKYVTSVGVDF